MKKSFFQFKLNKNFLKIFFKVVKKEIFKLFISKILKKHYLIYFWKAIY